MDRPGHPPLGTAARRVIDVIPDGGAVHLAVVSVVCNSLHRHAGPARAVECGRCPYRPACIRQVDDALLYVGRLTERGRGRALGPAN